MSILITKFELDWKHTEGAFDKHSLLSPCSGAHMYFGFKQSYARIGMAKEAADAASQTKDGELLSRLGLTFAPNATATSILDSLRDRLSFQGVS